MPSLQPGLIEQSKRYASGCSAWEFGPNAASYRLQFLHRQQVSSAVEHVVAIGADQHDIFDPCLASRFQLCNRNLMMGLDETTSQVAILRYETHLADRAVQERITLASERFRLSH
jgi:hypothetical protein